MSSQYKGYSSYDKYRQEEAKPNVKCPICGKLFYVKPKRIRRLKNGRDVCCSRECGSKYRSIWFKGENNHQFGLTGNKNSSSRDEKIINRYGYVMIFAPENYPMKTHSGRIFEHRKIVEDNYVLFDPNYFVEIDGKMYLKPEVEVHHINEIKTDNRIVNLVPLTKSEHVKIHRSRSETIRDNETGRIVGISRKFTKVTGVPVNIRSHIVKFKRFDDAAIIPTTSDGNAGYDFYSPVETTILPGKSVTIDTCIGWQPDENNLYIQMQGRSGLCYKHGIELCNAGVIDASYIGHIAVKLYNKTDTEYVIKRGDRIVQGIIFDLPSITVVEVTEFKETERGSNGFGSSGR